MRTVDKSSGVPDWGGGVGILRQATGSRDPALSAGSWPGAGWIGALASCARQPSCARRRARCRGRGMQAAVRMPGTRAPSRRRGCRGRNPRGGIARSCAQHRIMARRRMDQRPGILPPATILRSAQGTVSGTGRAGCSEDVGDGGRAAGQDAEAATHAAGSHDPALSTGSWPGAGWISALASCARQPSCARRRGRCRGWRSRGGQDAEAATRAAGSHDPALSAGSWPGAGWIGALASCARQPSCARRRARCRGRRSRGGGDAGGAP